jgi:GNAT superfamily N-acetyltransferase
MVIRPATPDDLVSVREVEIAAGSMFAAIGMTSDALDKPPDLAELREYVRDARLWVAVDDYGTPIGHIVMAIIDGNAHLEQVSVSPAHARAGIGHDLIEHAVTWARLRGLSAMTLTTYAEVPWNGPYYERLGFRAVPIAEWTPGLRIIREAEAAAGLDQWPCIVMSRAL